MPSHTVTIVFGREARAAYAEDGIDAAREAAESGGGAIVSHSFDTEAEVLAYRRGVEDAEGWMDFVFVEEGA